MLSVEEMVRTGATRTAENGLVFAVVGSDGPGWGSLDRMVASVPKPVVQRLGKTACYFVSWLIKQRRGVGIANTAAGEGETRKELCHHLDIKPNGNLLLISLNFYGEDMYGLAMEFFDKIAYIASLETPARPDYRELLEKQFVQEKGGELTPEAWEWRTETLNRRRSETLDPEVESNYHRAAETDSLGVYMASLFTDVFYEDLIADTDGFTPLPAEQLYERVRTLERLYPPNRGYSLQIVRQRPRRRSSTSKQG
ncbi:MAG: hypothetical protein ACYC6M_02410 [Terriglobales bacterium]